MTAQQRDTNGSARMAQSTNHTTIWPTTRWTLSGVIMACAMALGGCSPYPADNAAAGGLIGAAGGAAMGCLLTGPFCPAGAVIGGAATGALMGGTMGAASTPPPPAPYYYGEM